ncbi:MAG TPA: hypothetical protein P5531_02860 [Bacteroidales bacterium]|nr:hypothetical protein [Bacteroidales bacterium]HSA42540.1 hypothetical protein [Bacteroidales bacterium]
MKSLLKTSFLWTVLGVYGLFFLLTLYHRFIQIDENWFGEQAYWLAHEGVVRLKSMPGILGFENQMFLYHKLLVWMGAVLVTLTGWSVFPFKFITLACYLGFFIVFYRFRKENNHSISQQEWLLAVTLLVMIPIMLQQSFTFRPEVFVMTLGFVSFFFLDRYLRMNRKRDVIPAGIFSGLAFLMTLNGLIFPVAGAVMLLIYRKYRAFLLFSAAAGLISAFFLIDMLQAGRWEIFLYQLNHWPTRKFGENYLASGMGSFVLNKLLNLASEHQRFFWSDRVMAFSALFWLAYIFNFKYLWRNYKAILIYTTLLILLLNLTGSHIAERYLVFYYPFMALITAIGILRTEGRAIKYLKYAYILLLILNIVSLAKQFQFVFRENEDAATIHHEIIGRIPEQHPCVFAPWKFIFNEIDNCRVISYQALQYYQDDIPEKLSQDAVLSLLEGTYGVGYLILDADIRRDETHAYDWFRKDTVSAGRLELLFDYGQYRVFRLVKNPRLT